MKVVEANGARIPAIGMGTWTLKGRDCAQMVEHALQVGYRHIDTAAMYANEEAVGEGIRASGIERPEIFVTTKVWWTDLSPDDLRRSAEASLKRLRLDHVDLFLIHWPNPKISLSETIEALNTVKADGLAANIGVSNFTMDLLDQAIALSPAPLVAHQFENHPMLDQRKVMAATRKHGMACVSYCPLYRGGDLLQRPEVGGPAERYGKTPGQIVLRWHVQQDGVVAIPRTARKERLEENISVFDFALSDDEMNAISSLRSAHSRICDYDFSPRWDAA